MANDMIIRVKFVKAGAEARVQVVTFGENLKVIPVAYGEELTVQAVDENYDFKVKIIKPGGPPAPVLVTYATKEGNPRENNLDVIRVFRTLNNQWT